MSSPPAIDPVAELRAVVIARAAALRPSGAAAPATEPGLERPKRAGQGDYATNAAMLLAPLLGTAPREIAGRLGDELGATLGDALVRYEVAGPGFLNLVLSDAWHREAVRWVLGAGQGFAGGGAARPERVLLEFVSANPTGPLVAASGRHAAYGDALARILAHHGHSVKREYYFNDAGGQIRLLGESVRARALGEEVPEGGYQGDYVVELAREVPGAGDPSVGIEAVAAGAVSVLLRRIKTTLVRYGVSYDAFFSERTLHEGSPNAVQRALSILEVAGHVYRSDGAVWLRTTSFGDDKDRVVIRSSGEPTYLAGDIAYIQEKRERGFDRQLMPVGSDHHAYVRELKAAMAALGGDPETVEVPLLQFVHLLENGETFAMSKRRGDFVTLDDLLDEIGVDATRFFMLQRSHDRTLELDVALARTQSRENPVYYVQYAHARIASLLAKLGEERVAAAVGAAVFAGATGVAGAAGSAGGESDWDASGELHPSERELIKKLLALPDEIAESAEQRAPHRIAAYALELAQTFTAFYRDCRVVGATPVGVESFRVALCVASQRTLALVLGLLGVSAPDSM
jgi:arginyl-tRNA synthetase